MKLIILLIIVIVLVSGCDKEENIDYEDILPRLAYVTGYTSGSVDTITSIIEDKPLEDVICERDYKLDSEFTNYLVESFNITCKPK